MRCTIRIWGQLLNSELSHNPTSKETLLRSTDNLEYPATTYSRIMQNLPATQKKNSILKTRHLTRFKSQFAAAEWVTGVIDQWQGPPECTLRYRWVKPPALTNCTCQVGGLPAKSVRLQPHLPWGGAEHCRTQPNPSQSNSV